MPIYGKLITNLTSDELQQLLDEGAVENVRLEFKRQYVDKDEYLKKLSGFANTYGGYLIVGAEADNTGRLLALPGVDPIPSFKQRIVQWCYDGIAPPVHSFVSDAIPSPQDPGKVCYVIFVEESEEAPHFLNNRKGCYVRVDEYGQRVRMELATYEEIQHLANRRALCVERRERLFEHAERRFATYVEREYAGHRLTTGTIGTILKLATVPRFPAVRLVEELKLLEIVEGTQIRWRDVGFPARTDPLTQHESVAILDPVVFFSMFEASIWGQLYYATEVERADPQVGGPNAIHLYSLLGFLLVFLYHARKVYQALGYDGTLSMRLRVERVLGRHFWREHSEPIPASRLDDVIEFTVDSSSDRLRDHPDGVARDLIRRLFFAVNWAEIAASDREASQMVSYGYEYNFWHHRGPPT